MRAGQRGGADVSGQVPGAAACWSWARRPLRGGRVLARGERMRIAADDITDDSVDLTQRRVDARGPPTTTGDEAYPGVGSAIGGRPPTVTVDVAAGTRKAPLDTAIAREVPLTVALTSVTPSGTIP